MGGKALVFNSHSSFVNYYRRKYMVWAVVIRKSPWHPLTFYSRLCIAVFIPKILSNLTLLFAMFSATVRDYLYRRFYNI